MQGKADFALEPNKPLWGNGTSDESGRYLLGGKEVR